MKTSNSNKSGEDTLENLDTGNSKENLPDDGEQNVFINDFGKLKASQRPMTGKSQFLQTENTGNRDSDTINTVDFNNMKSSGKDERV